MIMQALDRIIELTFNLSRLMRHRMLSVAREGTTVNFLQIHTLAMVNERQGMTMKELADSLHVASPSATSFVNRLESLGWIAREHDQKNRKLVRLRVTPLGAKILREKSRQRTEAIRQALSNLSSAELESLASILEKITLSCSHPSSAR